ncbi:MAG: FkbM family methyltransferase [Chitinophagaceae bacterium]
MLHSLKTKYLRPLIDATGKWFLRNRDAEYRLYKKGITPRSELFRLKYTRQPVTESILYDRRVKVTDAFWFLHSLKEIFEEEVYKFECTGPAPRILDCGANIGLSAIYFKRLFPQARITAFEPDEAIAGMMRHNLAAFGYTDVAIQQTAAWTENTILKFNATGGLGGTLVEGNAAAEKVVEVKAVRLRDYLDEKVDFLKIDIEGAEADVLKDCADKLYNVERLFMEYHSAPGKPQELGELLGILKQAGFRIYIKDAWNNLPYPFLHNHYQPFYDLQLNIFAYREK